MHRILKVGTKNHHATLMVCVDKHCSTTTWGNKDWRSYGIKGFGFALVFTWRKR